MKYNKIMTLQQFLRDHPCEYQRGHNEFIVSPTFCREEAGNVFFYIFLAIALFAALSYAVSQGNRGNTSLLTDQQARLAAQEIIEYGNIVSGAVQKLKLRGCRDTQISFENNIETGYANATAPTDNSCHVFNNAGGAINYNNALGSWLITGHLKIQNVGGSTTNLNIILPSVQQSVCEQINIALSQTAPTVIDGYSGTVSKFDGGVSSYTAAASPLIGDTATDYAGKTSFCFQKSSGNFEFIQVLLSR